MISSRGNDLLATESNANVNSFDYQYIVNLQNYLLRHKYKKDDSKEDGFTMMPNNNTYNSGSYIIPLNEFDSFLKIYVGACYEKCLPSITESQPKISQLFADLDVKLKTNKRYFTQDKIITIITKYLHVIDKYVGLSSRKCYVLMRDECSKITKHNDDFKYKDGIHIHFPDIIVSREVQRAIRDEVINECNNIFSDLSIIENVNTINSIIDKSVIGGRLLMYGSTKNYENKEQVPRYKIKYVFSGLHWNCYKKLTQLECKDEITFENVKLLSFRNGNLESELTKYGLCKQNEYKTQKKKKKTNKESNSVNIVNSCSINIPQNYVSVIQHIMQSKYPGVSITFDDSKGRLQMFLKNYCIVHNKSHTNPKLCHLDIASGFAHCFATPNGKEEYVNFNQSDLKPILIEIRGILYKWILNVQCDCSCFMTDRSNNTVSESKYCMALYNSKGDCLIDGKGKHEKGERCSIAFDKNNPYHFKCPNYENHTISNEQNNLCKMIHEFKEVVEEKKKKNKGFDSYAFEENVKVIQKKNIDRDDCDLEINESKNTISNDNYTMGNGNIEDCIENKNKTNIIEWFYFPNLDELCPEMKREIYNSKQSREYIVEQGITAIIVAHDMGLGKTVCLNNHLIDHDSGKSNFLNYNKQFEKILWITYRQTITDKIYGDTNQLGFVRYNDKDMPQDIDMDEYGRVICQIDSLHRILEGQEENVKIDLLIMDEFCGILGQIPNIASRNKAMVISKFADLIRNSNRVVIMDAIMNRKAFVYLQQIFDGDLSHIKYIKNEYNILEGWNVNYHDPMSFNDVIEEYCKRKKFIAIGSLSKNKIEHRFGPWFEKYECNFAKYTSDTDRKEKKEAFQDVNKSFVNKSILYTTTMSSSISFTIPNHFESVFMCLNNKTILAPESFQMARRMRHPKRKEINIMIHNQKCNEDLPLTFEDMEKYIENQCNLKLYPEFNLCFPQCIRGKWSFPYKNPYYYFSIYNAIETNLNTKYFLDIWKVLSKKRGMIWREFSTNYNKETSEKQRDRRVKERESLHARLEYDIKKLTNAKIIPSNLLDRISKIKMRNGELDKNTDEWSEDDLKLTYLLKEIDYPQFKYQNLISEQKEELINYLLDKSFVRAYNNHKQLKNVIADTVEEKINKINEFNQIKIKSFLNSNFKTEYAKTIKMIDDKSAYLNHGNIHQLIKLIGFDSIYDKNEIDNNVIRNNVINNTEQLRKQVKEFCQLNKLRYRINDNIKIHCKVINSLMQAINSCLEYTYKLKLSRTNNNKNYKYRIDSLIDWSVESIRINSLCEFSIEYGVLDK